MSKLGAPFKQRLDYFAVDTNWLNWEETREMRLLYGFNGEAMIMRIITLASDDQGYYTDISLRGIDGLIKSILLEGLSKWITPEQLKKIILTLADLDFIDKKLLNKGIITGKRIQARFLMSSKRRKYVDTSRYWLLSKKETRAIDDYAKSLSSSTPSRNNSTKNKAYDTIIAKADKSVDGLLDWNDQPATKELTAIKLMQIITQEIGNLTYSDKLKIIRWIYQTKITYDNVLDALLQCIAGEKSFEYLDGIIANRHFNGGKRYVTE